ncbi:MAG: ABC transporter substrate-binding protein [Lachnospiraceae bacterium]|nr:ABC transporter substrate-binding protein [Lachnospiraceae bacterium]
MMKTLSRRDFLRGSAAGMATAALSGIFSGALFVSAEEAEKTVTVGITADPVSWDPWAAFSIGRRNPIGMIYQTLIAQICDPETGAFTSYNVMISGYEKISDDTYRVYVRDGIYDTAGNTFNANDVKFSLEAAQEKATMASMNDMVECTVVDDLTIDIVMGDTMAVGDFEEFLSAPNMVTQAAYEASEDEMMLTPVGTTGYVLADYVAGSSATITLADIPYWNADATSLDDGYCFAYETGNLDTVIFEIITDTSTMALALETGDIDISSSVSTTDMVLFADNPDYSVANLPDNIFYLIYNCSEDSCFQNENLRKAVAYCFDSEDCLYASFDGDGIVAKAWAYPGQIGYQDEWDSDDYEYFAYNLETAQSYLQAYYDETGTSASDLSIRLLCTTSSTHVKTCEVVQGAINELVGKECCELLQYETNSYNELRSDSTAFDVYLFYGLVNKPYVLYNWNLSCIAARSSPGLTGFKIVDDELQELMDACLDEEVFSDEDSWNQACYDFNEYVKEKCYTVAICTGYTHWVGKSFVTSYAVGTKNAIVPNAMTYDWSAK